MRSNKKDRRYHRIMGNKAKRHLDGSEENELNYEDTQRLFHLFRGKLRPWYKSKDKQINRKKRYSKRLEIKEQIEGNE